ncbi:odorant receptor 22c-like [Halyomorpha halys]|uniref:odorant receptor 22c-like n=1 Tax=Halyomorpha halys TaxID=286706 RepID=UPI0006D4E7DA
MKLLISDYDVEIDGVIEKTYSGLNTISAIYPVMDMERPRLCLINLFLFLFHSVILTVMTSSLVQASLELFYINFVPFVHELHLAFLGLLSIAILWHSWLKRSNVTRLHRIITQGFFDYKENLEDKMKVLGEDRIKERKRHILYVILIGFAASVVVILIPAVNQFGTFRYNSTAYKVNFDLPVPLPYPFMGTEPLDLLPGYTMIVVTASSIALMNCTKSFMAIDCNLHIQMQLKLLLHQIEIIKSRAGRLYIKLYGTEPKYNGLKLYDKKFMKCYRICLRRSIQHHQIIVRALNEFNEVFGFYVFFYYLTGTLDIAMSMLATSSTKEFPGTTIGALIICIVEVGFVFVFAHMGQNITDLSVELREVIYDMPWYRCDQETKTTMRVLQIATLKPLSFSFYSLLHINYDSFATVLHSAYSYYNLVNAKN